MNPFSPNNALKANAVTALPSDLYFVVRTVQLLRGIAFAFDVDFSLADSWRPYARRVLSAPLPSPSPSPSVTSQLPSLDRIAVTASHVNPTVKSCRL